MEKNREERIQDILNYIRFDTYGIQKAIEENNDLFEEDNHEHPFEEKENWNEDYINRNLVWLRKNFSKERLEHLIEVRNYVRGEIKLKSIEREEKNIYNKGKIKRTLSLDEKRALEIYDGYNPKKKKETKSVIGKVKSTVKKGAEVVEKKWKEWCNND